MNVASEPLNAQNTTEHRVRCLLGCVLALGIVGLGGELLLLEHVEDWLQLIPVVVLALGLAALLLHAARPGRGSVRLIQLVMLLFIAAGVTGVVLHYVSNAEFAAEVNPSLEGFALVRKALSAKTPPAVAPAMMAQLGLLGLVLAYRHPLTRRGA
jgi:hypothetical protein